MYERYQCLDSSKLVEVANSLSETLLKLPQQLACLPAFNNSLLGPDVQHANLVTTSTRDLTISSSTKEGHCIVEAELPATLKSPVLVLARMIAVPVAAVTAEGLLELSIRLRLRISNTRLDVVIGKSEIIGSCDGTVVGLLLEAPLSAVHPVLVL